MALDEAMADEAGKGPAPPTLRLYGWQAPAVSLGCFQRASEVNLEFCRNAEIPVVRRPTGGRAILHGDELTYSFVSATGDGRFSTGLFDSYRLLGEAFLRTFVSMGLHAGIRLDRKAAGSRSSLCFRSASYGEITVRGEKVIGSAQRRRNGSLLQQGSIPLTADRRLTQGVFGNGDAEGHITGLGTLMSSITLDALKSSVVKAFEDAFGIRLVRSRPSAGEEALAETLLQKYRSPAWNLRR
jgi:lipoate-protein ligase A